MDYLSILEDAGDSIQEELIRDYYSRRVLIIDNDISDWMLRDIALNIIAWNAEDKHIPVEERTPIKLIIDSEGGSPIIANNIINIIECSSTPVWGIVGSIAASAACSLLIGCDKRYAFKHSTMLVHDGSLNISQTNRKAKDTMKFFDKIDEITKNLILTRTKITEEEFEENKDREQYFLAEEAKEKGIIDGIIGIDVNLDDIL